MQLEPSNPEPCLAEDLVERLHLLADQLKQVSVTAGWRVQVQHESRLEGSGRIP